MMDPQDFRQVIREAMEHERINQSDLSKRSGVTKAAISRYFSGRRGVNDDTLAKLLAAVGVRAIYVNMDPGTLAKRAEREEQATKDARDPNKLFGDDVTAY